MTTLEYNEVIAKQLNKINKRKLQVSKIEEDIDRYTESLYNYLKENTSKYIDFDTIALVVTGYKIKNSIPVKITYNGAYNLEEYISKCTGLYDNFIAWLKGVLNIYSELSIDQINDEYDIEGLYITRCVHILFSIDGNQYELQIPATKDITYNQFCRCSDEEKYYIFAIRLKSVIPNVYNEPKYTYNMDEVKDLIKELLPEKDEDE